jgi:hypothetical protein
MKWLIIHIHTPGVYWPYNLVPDPQISTTISRNCAVLCHPWVASTSLVPKNWSKHSKLRLSYPPTNLGNQSLKPQPPSLSWCHTSLHPVSQSLSCLHSSLYVNLLSIPSTNPSNPKP